MMGAKIVFHPNAGLTRLRCRANATVATGSLCTENQVFYVFANSVGPQGGAQWSAGDSKIVAPDPGRWRSPTIATRCLSRHASDLSQAERKYARKGCRNRGFFAAIGNAARGPRAPACSQAMKRRRIFPQPRLSCCSLSVCRGIGRRARAESRWRRRKPGCCKFSPPMD